MTDDLYVFIRALEAPGGYDIIERRIRQKPPRRLTEMTLAEVLAWQREVRRSGAPSTAAGAYQIIYPTLSGLVRRHGLDRARKFDPPTQDLLARLLVARCGGTGPHRDVGRHLQRYGNCLAGIWAALPLTAGPRRGRSAHEGVAGNRALTDPETVLALLAGRPVPIPNPGATSLRGGNGGGSSSGATEAPRPLAFGAKRLGTPGTATETVSSEEYAATGTPGSVVVVVSKSEVTDAMEDAMRDNSLTRSVRSWKVDPYATR